MYDQLKRYAQREGFNFKSIVAFAIFGAIILVFALFGAPTRNKSSGVGAAARVNNSLISVADLRDETKQMEQMYAPMFGGAGMGDAQRQYLRTMALENLISREVVAEAAKDSGIMVSDREVAEYITSDIKAFQKDGVFQREQYQNYLDYMKMTAGEFEEKIRKDRRSQRARRFFEIAGTPLKLEKSLDQDLKAHKRNVQFIKLDKESWVQKTKVSDAEISEFKSKPDYDRKTDQYFQENKSKFVQPLEVRASHILIKVKPGDADADKSALAKIEELKARSAKEDFAKLAKENSQDFGSQTKGGDLGFFGMGKMDPAFEKAAFALKEGEVSAPVKSSFGYHLIKLTGRHEAKNPSLEDLKPEITRKLVAIGHYDDLIKKLEEILKSGDTKALDEIVKAQGFSWEETGMFDYSQSTVPKLSGNVLTKSVFELSEAHPVSKQVVRENTDKYILKLKEDKVDAIAPPSAKSMADSNMQREENYALFGAWAEQMKSVAKIEKNDEIFQSSAAQ